MIFFPTIWILKVLAFNLPLNAILRWYLVILSLNTNSELLSPFVTCPHVEKGLSATENKENVSEAPKSGAKRSE